MKFKSLSDIFPRSGGAKGSYGTVSRLPVWPKKEIKVIEVLYFNIKTKIVSTVVSPIDQFMKNNIDNIVVKDIPNPKIFELEQSAIIEFLTRAPDGNWDAINCSTILHFDPYYDGKIMISIRINNSKEYLTFEKMDGDLEMFTAKSKSEAMDVVANTFWSLTTFCEICQHYKFLHRDIKPANILYKRNSSISRYDIKVGDFTFLHSLYESSLPDTAGTPNFMLFKGDLERQSVFQSDFAISGDTKFAAVDEEMGKRWKARQEQGLVEPGMSMPSTGLLTSGSKWDIISAAKDKEFTKVLMQVNEVYAIVKTIAIIIALNKKTDDTVLEAWFMSLLKNIFPMFIGLMNDDPVAQTEKLKNVIKELQDQPLSLISFKNFHRYLPAQFADSMNRCAIYYIDYYLKKYNSYIDQSGTWQRRKRIADHKLQRLTEFTASLPGFPINDCNWKNILHVIQNPTMQDVLQKYSDHVKRCLT